MTPWFEVEVKTEGREVYHIEADNPSEATRKFFVEDLPSPQVSEVIAMDLSSTIVRQVDG